MSGAALSMAATAELCAVSHEHFRKVWRSWAAQLGFPRPFRGGLDAHGRRESYGWDADDVIQWKARRKAALGQAAPAPANDVHPADRIPGADRADRDRAAMASRMGARG